MEELDLTEVTKTGSEVAQMTFTITEPSGFVHELKYTKIEGQAPSFEMFGDTIKLRNRLITALAAVDSDSTRLV